ncbi:hypothetical protein RJ55_02854 [Drechmeria coniospora]|nr:hypothetical protein RJ55_02854 [Drechmeria coniospora]
MSQCNACQEPLVIRVDDDDEGANGQPVTVPDDLELQCGCHFHWECFMEEASSVAISSKCPGCESYLPVNEAGPSTATNTSLQSPSTAPILARYCNEGGVQDRLDILPSITEEAYVQNNPEVRPARAFHLMCSEGDVTGMIELLYDVQGDIGDAGPLVLYQDPLAEMRSALHLAVENKQSEAIWLLLWLASTVPLDSFPPSARQSAETVGIRRLAVESGVDIRALRDAHGRSAENLAHQNAGFWRQLLDTGVLS